MAATAASDTALWATTLNRARREVATLPGGERDWLITQVTRIGLLQGQLDRLFRDIGGPAVCTGCAGGCCSRARHHVTLTNLLGYLLSGEEAPRPDFTRDCPMLAEQGCRLPVEHRPFNCIIFLCEPLDAVLDSGQRHRFAVLEAELRAVYEAVAARCPGASLRGLLIASARTGARPLLTIPPRR